MFPWRLINVDGLNYLADRIPDGFELIIRGIAEQPERDNCEYSDQCHQQDVFYESGAFFVTQKVCENGFSLIG